MPDKFTWRMPTRRNSVGEFVIDCFKNGERYPDGDYYTDSREDAQGTYEAMVTKDLKEKLDKAIATLKSIGEWFGNGTVNSGWQQIVRQLGQEARNTLKEIENI